LDEKSRNSPWDWNVEKYWSDWDNTCILGNQPVSVLAFLKAIGFNPALSL
jgi:hypothetical protein